MVLMYFAKLIFYLCLVFISTENSSRGVWMRSQEWFDVASEDKYQLILFFLSLLYFLHLNIHKSFLGEFSEILFVFSCLQFNCWLCVLPMQSKSRLMINDPHLYCDEAFKLDFYQNIQPKHPTTRKFPLFSHTLNLN